MTKNILVFPRDKIASLLNTKKTLDIDCPWALISIFSDTSGPLVREKFEFEILASKGCVDFEAFDFHDVTKDYAAMLKKTYPGSNRKFKLFSKNQAKKMINFIDKLKRDDRDLGLVIHCEAGVSRSGAVGIFACRYLGIDEHKFRAMHPLIKPNPFVYDTLCEVSKMKGNFERF